MTSEVELRDVARLNESVHVRRVTPADALEIWKLANDTTVRMNSLNQESIPWEEHLKWFSEKVSSNRSRIWVLAVDGDFAGQVRYDRLSEDLASVHFAVSPRYRGRGYATLLLSHTFDMACTELLIGRVEATVLVGNEASSRSLIRAGYRYTRSEIKSDRSCLVYERGS